MMDIAPSGRRPVRVRGARAGSRPAADAQTRVRVIRDQTTIWRAGLITVATVVQKGAVLEVVARRGNWARGGPCRRGGGTRATGVHCAVNRVERRSRANRRLQPAVRNVRNRGLEPAPRPPVRPSLARRGAGASQMLATDDSTAHRSFDAVLGQPGGLWCGGGAEIRRGPGCSRGPPNGSGRRGTRVRLQRQRVQASASRTRSP